MVPTKKHASTKKKDPVLSWIQHASYVILCGILFIFLVANILYSQMMPEVYFAVATNQDGAIVPLMQQARRISSFWHMFPEVKNTMSDHSAELFAETTSHRIQIESLKQALEQNPRNPEVMYGLYLLYQAEEQMETAAEYQERALEIDPLIGKRGE